MNTPTSSSSLAAAATRTGKYERGEGQQKQPDRLQPGCNGQSPSFRRRPWRPSASLTPNCYTECLQHLHSSAIIFLACVTRLLHTRPLQTFLVSAPYSDCGAQSVTVPCWPPRLKFADDFPVPANPSPKPAPPNMRRPPSSRSWLAGP